MAEGVTEEAKPEISAETSRMAELGRNGDTVPARDPNVKVDPSAPQRPDDVPEKFWDAAKGAVNTEALMKSYLELEKSRSAPAEKVEEEGETEEAKTARIAEEKAKQIPEEKPKEGEEKPEGSVAAMTAAIEDARTAYATSGGELPEENRKALIAAGIPEAQLDLYLAGIAAQEKALASAAYEAAGGEEAYRAAVLWAAENWSEEEIAAFDGAIGNPKLMKTAVKGLMATFAETNEIPSEGKLVNTTAATASGDVYSNKEEFLSDLAKVQAIPNVNEQAAARKAAVSKLERSKKAGTVKEVTPRSGPFRN